MALIDLAPYKPVVGTDSDANLIRNAFDTLQTVVNGNVDTNNVAAAAAIKGSQLATGLNGPPGAELAYAEVAASVTVTGASEATATTIVTAPAFTFDGVVAAWIEFYTPTIEPASVAGGIIDVLLFEDGVSIGRLAYVRNPAAANMLVPVGSVKRKRTPASGARTYSVRAAQTGGNGTVHAGPGGAGPANAPGFIRVTKA